MTRPPTIRMNPTTLPPLTRAQVEKVKQHRRYWKPFGKVSVVRKGQVTGHMCITVTEPDKVRRMWYDSNANLVRTVIERPLFATPTPIGKPTSALLQQMEDK